MSVSCFCAGGQSCSVPLQELAACNYEVGPQCLTLLDGTRTLPVVSCGSSTPGEVFRVTRGELLTHDRAWACQPYGSLVSTKHQGLNAWWFQLLGHPLLEVVAWPLSGTTAPAVAHELVNTIMSALW